MVQEGGQAKCPANMKSPDEPKTPDTCFPWRYAATVVPLSLKRFSAVCPSRSSRPSGLRMEGTFVLSGAVGFDVAVVVNGTVLTYFRPKVRRNQLFFLINKEEFRF